MIYGAQCTYYVWCFKLFHIVWQHIARMLYQFFGRSILLAYAFCCHSLWQYSTLVHCWTSRVLHMYVCESVWTIHLLFSSLSFDKILSMCREYGHAIFGCPLVHQNRLYSLFLCVSVFLCWWSWKFHTHKIHTS